jgi:hypothetical protein
MTDPHHLDDLASAHLDGATTPEEAAVVEADPQLLARVEELRAVRAVLAEVPAVDATARERAISAALATFHEGADPDPDAAAAAAIRPLAPRRGLSPRTVRALGAAAALVVLALLVPLLADRSDDDDETASLEETGAALDGDVAPSAEGGAATPEPGSAASGDAATGSVALAEVLGAYEDLDALAAAVAASDAQERAAEDQSSTDLGPPLCQPGPAGGTLIGLADVAGQDVEVYLSSVDGTERIIVLERGTCERVGERRLP